jgi:hypothetical protein
MKYYVLERTGKHPGRWIRSWPFIEDADFDLGQKIDTAVTLPDPLEFPLKPLNPLAWDHGPEMPEYLEGTIPLFRDDLIAALEEAGVDNVDCYNAVITDPDNGQKHTNYKAVNILGPGAVAALKKSVPAGEKQASGALIFRDESTGSILVREDLKTHLIAKGFERLWFIEQEHAATP